MSDDAPAAGEVTAILDAWGEATPIQKEHVFSVLYQEIKKRAVRQQSFQSQKLMLEPTALVNEAYLRLVGSAEPIAGRGHFLALAAKVMRQVVIDRVREQNAAKRGAGEVTALTSDVAGEAITYVSVLDLDAALTELAEHQPGYVDIVEARVFAGLTIDETADALGVGAATVKRRWRAAQLWLAERLTD